MSSGNVRMLPLLEAFDAIMRRGSVGAAAEAMNVTQSAVSKQLAQLRSWFGDELFVRTRDGMLPTPRALALMARVQPILREAELLTAEVPLQPDHFEGPFVLCATDEVLARLLPDLVPRLADEAPLLELVTLPLPADYAVRQLESGRVDLVVAVNTAAPEQLLQRKLSEDHFVCVMHRDHRLAASRLTLKRYAGAAHVMVAPLGSKLGLVDHALAAQGLSRRVHVSLSSFHLLGEAVLSDRYIATVPSRVAAELCRRGPFVVREVPLRLRSTQYHALWHPRFGAEPRLRWMIEAVARGFEGEDRPPS